MFVSVIICVSYKMLSLLYITLCLPLHLFNNIDMQYPGHWVYFDCTASLSLSYVYVCVTWWYWETSRQKLKWCLFHPSLLSFLRCFLLSGQPTGSELPTSWHSIWSWTLWPFLNISGKQHILTQKSI